MANIDHTTQATFVATDPRSKTVFCCANQPVILAHPNIRAENVKDHISSFIGKLATAECLFLLKNHTTENLKASISGAKYIIEVERNVDDGFQCRYFILSRDKVIIKEERGTPAIQSATTVPASSSGLVVSRAAKSREGTVVSTETTSYTATIVPPPKRKKLTVEEMFTPSPNTFTKKRPTFGNVTVEIIGHNVPNSPEEDAYVEVHVKDIFGDKNPVAWHINNCFTLVGCRFHQPFVGESILKRVHVMKNTQRGKVWGEGEEPREVTGEWLKGGSDLVWGV